MEDLGGGRLCSTGIQHLEADGRVDEWMIRQAGLCFVCILVILTRFSTLFFFSAARLVHSLRACHIVM